MADISELVAGTIALLGSKRIGREQRFKLVQVLETILPFLTTAEITKIKRSEIYLLQQKTIFEQVAAYWHQQECALVEGMIASGDQIDHAMLFNAHIPLSAYQHEIDFFKKQKITSIMHVGSGAFPASAFVLEDCLPNTRITCVERCERSFQLSINLIAHLGSAIQVVHSDISQISDFRNYDCILVSLNVLHQENVVVKIEQKISRPTLLVTRSASGWASLLYPEGTCHDAQLIEIPKRQGKATRAALSFRWLYPH